jgi:hypothetical protein
LQTELVECKFEMVRFHLFHTQPCTSWNERTETGTYNWSRFDMLMNLLQKLGVENVLICVCNNMRGGVPQGMQANYMNTGFPNPESFAAYCKDIASHVKSKGYSNAKYWEPWNEPYQVFDNNTAYTAFVNLFNTASDAVLQILPYASFGVDISNVKSFLDQFVYDGRNVGFLSFHKYDAWGTWLYQPEGYLSDSEILTKASTLGDKNLYTPQEMRNKWYSIRGKMLPIFCTETNLNSAEINGTDPRIQQVIGATWYAEELRAFILTGVQYSVYFQIASDDSPRWETDKQTKGYGFGMVNSTPPNDEWYPYLINHMLGNNLNVGDNLYNCASKGPKAVSILAWRSNSFYNVLLIGKVNVTLNVSLYIRNARYSSGVITVYRIDGSAQNVQIGEVKLTDCINILENGYFVILMQFS